MEDRHTLHASVRLFPPPIKNALRLSTLSYRRGRQHDVAHLLPELLDQLDALLRGGNRSVQLQARKGKVKEAGQE